jgi:hypothetical protein
MKWWWWLAQQSLCTSWHGKVRALCENDWLAKAGIALGNGWLANAGIMWIGSAIKELQQNISDVFRV